MNIAALAVYRRIVGNGDVAQYGLAGRCDEHRRVYKSRRVGRIADIGIDILIIISDRRERLIGEIPLQRNVKLVRRKWVQFRVAVAAEDHRHRIRFIDDRKAVQRADSGAGPQVVKRCARDDARGAEANNPILSRIEVHRRARQEVRIAVVQRLALIER